MEELDYWRLCEELNIVQAALLVVGEEPNLAEYTENWEVHKRPLGYEATKTAISGALKLYKKYLDEVADLEDQTYHLQVEHPNAPDLLADNQDYLNSMLRRSIAGELVSNNETDINGNLVGGAIDVNKSTVKYDSLKQWLAYKGFRSGFFFPEPAETLDFLDPLNPRYAPKLSAAVRAWQAVTDPGKRSPKQALDKWLRENAAQFGLTNEDGKPVEQAIEECSKVANWNAKGGATKTPS
ncbi:hypothetical protein N8303_03850 [Gammaproteobacteria bacterium]|nr:hypothetical protein [Gammaproteobacteria bacterium]